MELECDHRGGGGLRKVIKNTREGQNKKGKESNKARGISTVVQSWKTLNRALGKG